MPPVVKTGRAERLRPAPHDRDKVAAELLVRANPGPRAEGDAGPEAAAGHGRTEGA